MTITGGGLSPLTVTVNELLLLSWPSLTHTVINPLPVWPVAGVTVTVRFDPLPPKTMFVSGTRVGLDELPLTLKLLAAASRSPTVKLIGPAALPVVVV